MRTTKENQIAKEYFELSTQYNKLETAYALRTNVNKQLLAKSVEQQARIDELENLCYFYKTLDNSTRKKLLAI